MRSPPAAEPNLRPDRYASRLLHDETNVQVVAFDFLPGKAVPPHRSDSTVAVQVEGQGIFRGKDGEARLGAGGTAVYDLVERQIGAGGGAEQDRGR